MHKVTEQIIQPTITGLMQEKIAYRGFIFFGLIKVNNAPYVIEYNCRMGDPETEVVMPRLKNDLVELLNAAACQKLDKFSILKDARTAATIMLVSKGYPEKYITGKVIDQLPPFNKDQMIFQAGTQKHEGKLLTSGGRVISVTCLADTLQNALEKAKHLADEIQFDGKYYRKDIGWEFLS